MSITLNTRLKVSSVNSINDPEGHENIKITFIEIRTRPPMVAMMPQDSPKELSSIVFQIQQGMSQILPKGMNDYQFQKIVLVFTPEELESFQIKPYPNQIYDVSITNGSIKFRYSNL